MAVSDERTLRTDAARNRGRIVAAAAEVFAERGLEASVAEVAERAGVGSATVFRRFPTKQDLVDTIIADQLDAVVADAAAAAADPDPRRGLETFCERTCMAQAHDQGFKQAVWPACSTTSRCAAAATRSWSTWPPSSPAPRPPG